MRRYYKNGYAVKRDYGCTRSWQLFLYSAVCVGVAVPAGRKYGHRWRVHPNGVNSATRLFADRLDEAIDIATERRSSP